MTSRRRGGLRIGRYLILSWAVGCAAACAAGCSHLAPWPQEVRSTVASAHVGRTFELRHTQVVGEMYDDNERDLLSPYPFTEVFHHVDLAGSPIHPTRPRALIPAGTQVKLIAVDYPGPLARLRRMPATPHEAVWLQLEVTAAAAARGDEGARKPLLMPLPRHVRSAPALATALGQVLAPPSEVSRWLRGRTAPVQVAIAHKEAQVGMSEDEMTAALGPPWRWLTDALPGGPQSRVAWYPHQEIWLQHAAIVALRPSRHAP